MPIRKDIPELEIELEPSTKPILRPIYKMSPKELDEVRKQIDFLLERDFIKLSRSPWGA